MPWVDEYTMRPSTSISPETGRSSPAIERSVVVLPQPDGPSSVNSLPSGTSNETSCAALTTAPCSLAYSVNSDVTLSTFVPSQASEIPNRLPTSWATITRQNSRMINMTPSAESSTYWPFCHSSQIMIDTTSVPGLYSRIELESSRIETITT